LLENLPDKPYAYFVHSYYCVPTDETDILITVDYGIPFTAGVEHDNVYGVQFHPEQSQQVVLQILSNFFASEGLFSTILIALAIAPLLPFFKSEISNIR